MDIRARRRAAGMSQAQLARAAQIAQPNLSAYENGRRSPSPDVFVRLDRALEIPLVERIQQHRGAIRELVARHHARDARVFGSVARGDVTETSDLDLVVDFTDDASLLDEVGLRLALRDLLDLEVDVVGADSLRGEMSERVLREATPL